MPNSASHQRADQENNPITPNGPEKKNRAPQLSVVNQRDEVRRRFDPRHDHRQLNVSAIVATMNPAGFDWLDRLSPR